MKYYSQFFLSTGSVKFKLECTNKFFGISEDRSMRFISLVKFKKKPTKESIEQNLDCISKETKKEGVELIGYYWTLGRYDAVIIMEAPDEKAALKISLRRGSCMATETMVAIPAEEAREFIR